MKEIVTIKITMGLFERLRNRKILQPSDYEVKNVDVDDFDYTNDDVWQKLKKESVKAYKALKKREFELRNK